MWPSGISHSSEEFHQVWARRRWVSGCTRWFLAMKPVWGAPAYPFLIPQPLASLLALQCLLSPVCWYTCLWGCRSELFLQGEVAVVSF